MRASGSLISKLILLLTLSVLATTSALGLLLSPGLERVPPTQPPLSEIYLPSPQTIADFDGDRMPDRAELISNGFHKNIHLALSSPWVGSLDFSAETQQAGSLRAEDIDHDSDNDLVWISDRQLTHTALWLNNGIGEFTRINEPAAYADEIKRMVARERGNGRLTSTASDRLSAIMSSGITLLARPDDQLLEVKFSISSPGFLRRRVAELSPCISRYPKRGPPFFLFLV